MKRICCVCKKFIGTKEPLHDETETHGMCSPCMDASSVTSELMYRSLIERKNFDDVLEIIVSHFKRRDNTKEDK